MTKSRKLKLRDLVFLNISSVVGLTSLAQVSLFGYGSTILYLLAILLFFIPCGLMVAELNVRIPKEGGFYQWTSTAFGELHGYIAAWCYWLSNIVWFPTAALMIAGTVLYLGGKEWEHLLENPSYNLIVSLVALWTVTLLNIVGLEKAKWIQNIGAVSTWMVVLSLIVMALYKTVTVGPSEVFSFAAVVSPLYESEIVPFFAVVAFSFGGIELSSVLSDEIEDPKKNLPRSIFLGAISIGLIYILGSLAISIIIPRQDINVISGVMQVFSVSSEEVELSVVSWIGVLLILLSTFGLFGSWITGNARIPFVIGLDNYLPKVVAKVHPRFKTPYIALLLQGFVLTFLFILSMAGSTVKEAFLVLLDMSIVLYFVPFLYMFLSLIVHVKRNTGGGGIIALFQNRYLLYLVAFIGFSVTLFSMLISCFPSKEIANPGLFLLKVIGGAIFLLSAGLFVFYLRKRKLNL